MPKDNLYIDVDQDNEVLIPMCNKIPYDTKEEARRQAKFMFKVARSKKSHVRPPTIQHPYFCYGCGKWHLTSQTPKQQKQFKRHKKN